MPKKSTELKAETVTEDEEATLRTEITEDETEKLNRMLASVLNYLSDDEVEEIDIEVILDKTEGLREWWNRYREGNKKQIAEEIKKSLSDLSLKDLESIREQIKELKV